MPTSLGLLWFSTVRAVAGLAAVAALMLFVCSLCPAVWVDPPSALRPRQAARERSDTVALFRAAEAHGVEGRQEAARAALSERFPRGSDAAVLMAFLATPGAGGQGECHRTGPEYRFPGYRCHVWYGSTVGSILGLDRWRGGEWIVGIEVAPDSNAIDRVVARVPFLGKG